MRLRPLRGLSLIAGNGNEMETGNGNWKQKLETENRMKKQPLSCCSHSNVVGFSFLGIPVLSLPPVLCSLDRVNILSEVWQNACATPFGDTWPGTDWR